MGFQNSSRPRKLDALLTDISFDISDLLEYTEAEYENKISREELHKALAFVKESVVKLEAGLRRKSRRKKEE